MGIAACGLWRSWRGGRQVFWRRVKPNLSSASIPRHGCEAQLPWRRPCACATLGCGPLCNRGCLEREEASVLLASYPKEEAAEAQSLGETDSTSRYESSFGPRSAQWNQLLPTSPRFVFLRAGSSNCQRAVFPRRFRVPAYQSLVPPPAPALEAEMSAVHRGDGGTPRREYLELWTFFLCSTQSARKTVRDVY